MKINDTTTRTVTIVLEGTDVSDIKYICRGFMEWYGHRSKLLGAPRTAENILKSLEVDR